MRLAARLRLEPLVELTVLPIDPSWSKGRDKEAQRERQERQWERRKGKEKERIEEGR